VTISAGQTLSIAKDDKENFELNANTWSYLEESIKDDPIVYGLLSVIDHRNPHNALKGSALVKKTKYDRTCDVINMTTLENERNGVKMSNGLEDPDIWSNKLERIRGLLINEVVPAIKKNDTVIALKISPACNLPNCYISVYTNLMQVRKQGDLEQTMKEIVQVHYKSFIENCTPEELSFITS
jgi:hypothetical protein